jgi:hypothetical protein
MHVAAGPGHTALSSFELGVRASHWLRWPWPRPHLAASKLVELRSSVDLVAMPHQPLDRHTPEPINPALRRVATQSSWNWAIMGSPRCGCRGESQRAGDTDPDLRDVRYAHIAPPLGCLGVAPYRGWPLRPALAPLARLAQPVARRSFRVGIIAVRSLRLGATTFSC